MEGRNLKVNSKSLGEQLDEWCDQLSSAAGAGLVHRVSPLCLIGVAPETSAHGFQNSQSPHLPQPIQPNLRNWQNQSHLMDLNLPKSNGGVKSPTGSKSKFGGRVDGRKSLKKIPSYSKTKEEKKKNEKMRSRTKGKTPPQSRRKHAEVKPSPSILRQIVNQKNSNSTKNHFSPSSVPDHAQQPQRQPDLGTINSSVHYSESESDTSDSDSDGQTCGKTINPNRPRPISAVRIFTDSLHRAKYKSSTKMTLKNTEISDLSPVHSLYKTEFDGDAFSKETINLSRLPLRIPKESKRRLSLHFAEKLWSNSPETSIKTKTYKSLIHPEDEKEEIIVKMPEKKKKIKPSIISLVKPMNLEFEKTKFMQSKNYSYNPQFEYKNPIDQSTYKRHFKPDDKLITLAMKILNNTLLKHGSYEKFVESTGGHDLTGEQIREIALKYLRDEGLEEEVNIKLCPDLVSRACMTRLKGKPFLLVQTHQVPEGWIAGLLRHEIGTHYLRSCNNRCQIWHKKKKRRELEMEGQNPTEEGLACLHSVLLRSDPLLFRAALLYYAVARGSDIAFSALFHDLSKFVKDPEVRWDYCLRAKRGLTDTSIPGAFSKDQVYLKGATGILKHRKIINFPALMRLGKVSYLDVDRLLPLASQENTRIPSFMRDLQKYHNKLNNIILKNGLTDEDLRDI